jgi:hypothetical protein
VRRNPNEPKISKRVDLGDDQFLTPFTFPTPDEPSRAMDVGGGAGEQLSLAAVRDQLIREEDSIVFALIERAKRPRNAPAYSAAAGGVSLAEFFVREAEALHAKARLVPFSASYRRSRN